MIGVDKANKFLKRLALLLALESRGNVQQVKVPMFEAPYLPRGIEHNGRVLLKAGIFNTKVQ